MAVAKDGIKKFAHYFKTIIHLFQKFLATSLLHGLPLLYLSDECQLVPDIYCHYGHIHTRCAME